MAELTGAEVVLSRDEFVDMLSANVDGMGKVADAVDFVVQAMRLQNDAGRPAYVLSVGDGVTPEGVDYVRSCMSQLGVAAVLVPKGCLEYVATLTPRSMGVEGANIRERLTGGK